MTPMVLIFHDEKTGGKAWWNSETSEVLISGDSHFAYALAREVMLLRAAQDKIRDLQEELNRVKQLKTKVRRRKAVKR